MCPYKDLYPNVRRNFIWYSQELEKTQMQSIGEWINEWCHIVPREDHSVVKQSGLLTHMPACGNRESQRNHAKGKKPDTKYTLSSS